MPGVHLPELLHQATEGLCQLTAAPQHVGAVDGVPVAAPHELSDDGHRVSEALHTAVHEAGVTQVAQTRLPSHTLAHLRAHTVCSQQVCPVARQHAFSVVVQLYAKKKIQDELASHKRLPPSSGSICNSRMSGERRGHSSMCPVALTGPELHGGHLARTDLTTVSSGVRAGKPQLEGP